MKFIDIIGLPGSGKSTIMKDILLHRMLRRSPIYSPNRALLLGMKRVNVDSKYHFLVKYFPRLLFENRIGVIFCKSNYFSHYLIRYLSIYGKSLSTYFELPEYEKISEKERKMALKYFLLGASRYSFLNESIGDDAIVLFDESLSQRSLSFFNQSHIEIPDNSIVNYLRKIPKPSMVVFVKTPPDECMRRMQKRNQGIPERIKQCSMLELLERLQQMEGQLESISQFYKKNGVKVLVLENDHSHKKLEMYKKIVESIISI
ncbi:hypothetical protein B4O97_15885 [Marispirochaeta aestuarii]|uniref:Deoxynucleoside kinase domain-containing protein n=1 Tax=Marispirochaeta aestuarii TaxID=1963862 RepID=A0A1Y1RVH7_9SPIO|nr:deoxynucleoside kinase [Marispirochaeta aestuarii]ORC32638.1 hypothetical protein B4O97_15885 [Marispirochaeta aestuarii]